MIVMTSPMRRASRMTSAEASGGGTKCVRSAMTSWCCQKKVQRYHSEANICRQFGGMHLVEKDLLSKGHASGGYCAAGAVHT